MSSSSDAHKTQSLVAFSDSTHGKLSLTGRFITENDELKLSEEKADVTCMVQYLGCWFAIHADEDEKGGQIRIHAILGYLPYSYVSPFARNNIKAVVKAAGKKLGGRVFFDNKQRIIFAERIRTKGLMTPELIVTEATKTMLRLKPYLELVNMLQPPPYPVFEDADGEESITGESNADYCEEAGTSNT